MPEFQSADYVMGAVTLGAAILGMFGGFSGALGFCAGFAAAGASVRFARPLVANFLATQWAVALGTLVIALLAFGIARAVVRRVVKGLLAQPADAIFGFLVAAATGAAVSLSIVFAVRHFLEIEVPSAVYQLVMGYFG